MHNVFIPLKYIGQFKERAISQVKNFLFLLKEKEMTALLYSKGIVKVSRTHSYSKPITFNTVGLGRRK